MRHPVSLGPAAGFALLSLLVAVITPQPAMAQSLLESIFGFLGSKPEPAPRAVPRPQPVPGLDNRQHRNPFAASRYAQPATPWSRSGRYKTVCVRLCDGYYFPISNSSRKRDFYDDAQRCQARCSETATRLYYLAPSASIEEARDQRGLAYARLKTAFLYRKTLKKACTCRPKPWSVSERMRHKSYELAEQNNVKLTADGNVPTRNSAEVEATSAGIGEFVPANVDDLGGEPQIVSAPTTVPRASPPREVRHRPYASPTRVRYVPSRQSRAARPKRPSASPSFGGLPPVKYRHNWSSEN